MTFLGVLLIAGPIVGSLAWMVRDLGWKETLAILRIMVVIAICMASMILGSSLLPA